VTSLYWSPSNRTIFLHTFEHTKLKSSGKYAVKNTFMEVSSETETINSLLCVYYWVRSLSKVASKEADFVLFAITFIITYGAR
jgi:hypothetical protein